MAPPGLFLLPLLVLFLASGHVASESSNKNVAFLDQSFAFDYAPPTQDPPIPITAQCEVINIHWGREGFTTGPNPVAPYYLQVYSSAYKFPFIISTGDPSTRTFDWPVPFAPGTQYQICMFDSNGNSGGCQRMYTVIEGQPSSGGGPPVCANYSFPASILDIKGDVSNGPISQFGWIDSCSDISLTPQNGTPPFTFTVAPTLRPPWNITSDDMTAVNWTVQLSWGSPFFISLVDSQGETWAIGPLHSGKGTTGCLSAASQPKNRVPESIAVGSGVGGAVLGVILGILGAWCFQRRRQPHEAHFDHYDMPTSSDRILPFSAKDEGHALDGPSPPTHYTALSLGTQTSRPQEGILPNPHSTQGSTYGQRLVSPGSGYEVEPFHLPTGSEPSEVASTTHGATTVRDHGQIPPVPTLPRHRSTQPLSPTTSGAGPSSPDAASGRGPSQQVYVVHHDGGRAPVSVYTPEGTEVIELPPRYTGGAASPAPPTRPALEQRREVSETPRKLLPTPPGAPAPGGSR